MTAKQRDLRYGDLCQRCNAASGIDTCPNAGENCPLEVKRLPKNYYKSRNPIPTAREKVKKRHPQAWCFPMLGGLIHVIASSENAPFDNLLGVGLTEREAWESADRRSG